MGGAAFASGHFIRKKLGHVSNKCQASSYSAHFAANPREIVDTANRPWPTSVAPRRISSVGRRVARSLPERWPAVLPRGVVRGGSRPSTRAQKRGQPGRCPFQSGAEMDAKTRDLALLAALSFICTGVAWIWGYIILGSVFFVLGGIPACASAQSIQPGMWVAHCPKNEGDPSTVWNGAGSGMVQLAPPQSPNIGYNRTAS